MAVVWKGRSGRLDFCFPTRTPDGSSGRDSRVSITFTHAGHGDVWEDSLDDALALLRESSPESRDFWVGDFQAERRPIFQGRIDKERWDLFDGACEALGLRQALPVEGVVSRKPQGLLRLAQNPSYIDHAAVPVRSSARASIVWDDAPGDHAWVDLFPDVKVLRSNRGPTTWRCADK